MSKKYYIESFPYEIELTARICHENAKRLLETLTNEISLEEFSILDTIIARPGLSQADLARLVLKGKAHTGRFIMSLEEKGFVKRHVKERDGKLIKIAVVTESGKNLYDNIVGKMKPVIDQYESMISEVDIDKMIQGLRDFREKIEKINKIVFE